MSGNVNIGQITVNVNDTIPPDNYATVDAGTKVGTVYTKEQNNAWRKEVEQNTNAGIKGVAKPDDTIVTTGFYRMLANTAETYTNYKNENNEPIVVNADDLNVVSGVQRNEVIIEVNNGVSEKKVFAKVGADGANGTATIPQWVADDYSPNAMVVRDFVQYIAPNGALATDVPGESVAWVSLGVQVSDSFNPTSTEKVETGKSVFNYLKTIKSDGENLVLKGGGNIFIESKFQGWNVYDGAQILSDINGSYANLPPASSSEKPLVYLDVNYNQERLTFIIDVEVASSDLRLLIDDSQDPIVGLSAQLVAGINEINFDATNRPDKTVIIKNFDQSSGSKVRSIKVMSADFIPDFEIPLNINKKKGILKEVKSFVNSDFVTNSNFTINNGTLNLNSQGLTQFNWGTLDEDSDLEFIYTENTASGTFFGFKSQNSFGYNHSVYCVYQTSGGNAGKIEIYNDNLEIKGSSSQVNTNYNVGDVLKVSIKRVELLYTFSVTNLTKGWKLSHLIQCTPLGTPFVAHNQSKPAIYLYGGSISVYEYKLSSLGNYVEEVHGDSITFGQAATDHDSRYASLIKGNILVAGGGADTTQNLVNRLPEIRARNPRRVYIMIGGNDKLFGFSDSIYQNNLKYSRNYLSALGIEVVHLLPTPRTHAIGIINFLKTEPIFARDLKIDTNTALCNGSNPEELKSEYDSGDGLHPNNEGMAKIAEIINSVI